MSASTAGRTEKCVHAPKKSRASRPAAESECVDPRPSAVVAEWSWRAATILRDDHRAAFQG